MKRLECNINNSYVAEMFCRITSLWHVKGSVWKISLKQVWYTICHSEVLNFFQVNTLLLPLQDKCRSVAVKLLRSKLSQSTVRFLENFLGKQWAIAVALEAAHRPGNVEWALILTRRTRFYCSFIVEVLGSSSLVGTIVLFTY